MLRVYVETTVWSFAFADDSPDFRAATLAFLDRCRRGELEAWVSSSVLIELGNAEEPLASKLKGLIGDVSARLLPEMEAVTALAESFVALRAVPPSKPIDARHVAAAYVGGLDVLVSWNFKHIASLRRIERFAAIAALSGYHAPLRIITPLEALSDGNE